MIATRPKDNEEIANHHGTDDDEGAVDDALNDEIDDEDEDDEADEKDIADAEGEEDVEDDEGYLFLRKCRRIPS